MKPILVGGLGQMNYGKQYKQGNRVYDSNAIAMCICAQPLGHAGGYSYLYLVRCYETDSIRIYEQRNRETSE